MPINFLDNVQLNQNQLLGARLQVESANTNVASPVSGQLIYNSTSNKVNYYNGADWISVPDGTGIGGSGTVNTIPVFTSTGEIGDSRLETSGQTSSATFTFQTTGLTTFVGDVKVSGYLELAAGLKDKDGDLGTSGQLLSSTGTATNWINAPVSYTSWTVTADNGASVTVGDGQTVDWAGGTGITTSYATPSGQRTVTTSLDEATATVRGGIELFSNTDQLVSANSVSATANRTYGIQLNPIGQAVVNVPWTNTNTNTTYTLPTSQPNANTGRITLTGSDGSTDTVNFVGTTNETEVTQPTSGVIAIGLPNNVTLGGDLTVSGGDITLGGTGRIQGVDTVSAGTDAVNKTYVDNAVVGNLVFQGGYDAANNTPDLDSSPSSSIKKGWAYVVTAAGNFFTEAVEVGDFLFAQSDAPTTLADWVTVQNNVGLATASSVGIGNVAASTDSAGLGVNVSYSSGTATVAWAIKALSTMSNAIVDADFMAILDQSTNEQKRITLSTLKTYFQAGLSQGFAGTSSSGTTHTFNHNLNTLDVIVQVYDASNNETVYASVDRTSVNQVVVTTASSANIRCLINNVG